ELDARDGRAVLVDLDPVAARGVCGPGTVLGCLAKGVRIHHLQSPEPCVPAASDEQDGLVRVAGAIAVKDDTLVVVVADDDGLTGGPGQPAVESADVSPAAKPDRVT